jgi:phosphoglycolate phosphatase
MHPPLELAGVLFDLDGVLVDSRVAIARSMNHALASCGLAPWPEERLYRFIGPPLHDAFRELIEAQQGDPGDPALVDACVARYRERYRDACLRETLAMDGVAELVRGLRLRCGVATSKPEAFAVPILETLGMRSLFGPVVGPSLGARSEAKRHTVARALAALDAGGAVAMVGDRHHDVVAGRAHGLVTIGVLWGIGSRAELEEAGADHVVTTPAELGQLLGGAP